ncbi:hypothetical protein ABVT39_017038 [Epinephelus coioides]
MALDNDYNDSYYDYIDCIDMEYEYEYEIKPSFHLFIPVCCCLIVCISIPANSLLLWALLRERAWKTASDILLLQLTISDLFFTVSLPFEAYQILHGWIFGCSIPLFGRNFPKGQSLKAARCDGTDWQLGSHARGYQRSVSRERAPSHGLA